MNFKEILDKANKEYPQGTRILGRNNSVYTVHGNIRLSDHYDILVSDSFGVIYDFKTQKWAEKTENNPQINW